jgi:hypothetical protein
MGVVRLVPDLEDMHCRDAVCAVVMEGERLRELPELRSVWGASIPSLRLDGIRPLRR